MFKNLTLFEKITLAVFELAALLLTTGAMLAIALASPSLNEAGALALIGFGLIIFNFITIVFCMLWDVDV